MEADVYVSLPCKLSTRRAICSVVYFNFSARNDSAAIEDAFFFPTKEKAEKADFTTCIHTQIISSLSGAKEGAQAGIIQHVRALASL